MPKSTYNLPRSPQNPFVKSSCPHIAPRYRKKTAGMMQSVTRTHRGPTALKIQPAAVKSTKKLGRATDVESGESYRPFVPWERITLNSRSFGGHRWGLYAWDTVYPSERSHNLRKHLKLVLRGGFSVLFFFHLFV